MELCPNQDMGKSTYTSVVSLPFASFDTFIASNGVRWWKDVFMIGLKKTMECGRPSEVVRVLWVQHAFATLASALYTPDATHDDIHNANRSVTLPLSRTNLGTLIGFAIC